MLKKSLCRTVSLLLATAFALPASAGGDTCAPVQKFAPGVISTDELWEWRLTFAPSGNDAYWATSVGFWPATREKSFIKTSSWSAQTGWSAPEIASFSGDYADFDPFVSPDGRTLYFSSFRPIEEGGPANTDMDLWMVHRTNTGWGEPIHLGDGPNRDGYDELYASVDLHGNLYFGRVKAPFPTEDVSIFRSERLRDGTFGPAELVENVNTPQRWEFNPEISPDGRTLVFTRLDFRDALPDEGYGFGDLYVSRQDHGSFAPAINLGSCINTAADEFHPTVAWGSQTIFFARGGRTSDFYVTRLKRPR